MHISRLVLFLYISFIASVQLGIVIPFFPMIAYEEGISESVTGIVAAMTPLGGLVVTLFSEKILRRLGFQRTIILGLAGNFALFVLLWVQPLSIVSWIIARFFMGMMFSLTFMPAQTSIGIETKANRAFYVNLIGVVFVIGLTIGPILTNLFVYGASTVIAVMIGLQLTSLFASVFVVNSSPPQSERQEQSWSRLHMLSKIWIAFIPALVFGCVELSLMSLFPQEALSKGFSIVQISTWIAAFSFSALLSQLPMSMLADKFSPRTVAAVLYPLMVVILIIPFWSFTYWSLLGVSIGLGICIGHGYYFAVAYVNSIVRPDQVVKSNILLEMMYNVTTIMMPIVVGYYLYGSENATIFVPLLLVAVLAFVIHDGQLLARKRSR